jgi:transposase
MIRLTEQHKYYMYIIPVDMRNGFDGLSGIIRTKIGMDPMDESVYIFINNRRDKMKMLVWEYGGYMIYYKRLERGTFEIPKPEGEKKRIEMTWEKLIMMIKGLKIIRKKRYEKLA